MTPPLEALRSPAEGEKSYYGRPLRSVFTVEIIQRRLFVRVVVDFSQRLLRVRAETFDRLHGPELVNRFFDVVTVQKSAALLLMDGLSLIMQTLLGLILLAVYHPLLLFLRLPLLRDRDTDRRRADLLLSELAIELADASIEKQRLKLLESAAKSYWEWVFAGQGLRIAEELLEIADERAGQVEAAVEFGQLATIDIVDNRRAILQRRSAVVSAGRELQNTAFEISMFYRGDDGQPIVPAAERLPVFPEPDTLDPLRIEGDLNRALERRPEVVATMVERRQAEASLRLARNNALPGVDFSVSYSRDNGTGSITKFGSELIAGLNIETPFQRRKAKGDMAVQRAKLAQLDQKLRFARDRATVEVRDAVSAIETALQRLELARGELDAARQLAAAERERFELGDSTLFVVNLRELSAAAAQLKVAKALAEYHKSVAVYRSAVVGW